MGFLAAMGHMSTFLTIESSIQSVIQTGPRLFASMKLKHLRGTLDFSAFPEEFAYVLDKAEGYLAEKKPEIQGGTLFSPEEKAAFVEDFFKTHPNALPYRREIEEILSDYMNQSELYLLTLMGAGEKVIYCKEQQIKRDVEQMKAKLDALSTSGLIVSPVPPDSVPKISYDIPDGYIPRKVIPHEVAMLNEFERIFQANRPITLIEAYEANDHLLLLSDAGHGKSIELQNLAGTLCETSSFPFLYSLSLYCGGPIRLLLPELYQNLPSGCLVLLFDGYDEMRTTEREEFMRRLQSFIKDEPFIKVVISSRSNFCNAEIGNQSRPFQGFQVYHLDDLSNDDILNYLSGQAVDAARFSEATQQSGTAPLLQNPFYLTRLVQLYQKDCQLPGKTEVMDYLISESFQLDDQKFQGSLEEQRRNLFVLLEQAAIAMQLMQKPALDDSGEYQELFTLEERSLLKCSGLLRKDGATWRFTHNNFKEYLSAKYLSRLPREESIRYFSDGYDIKMSWVNTFGFFLNMKQEWDLKSWVLEHAPAALVKFEPDHLETEIRVDIFKSIFLEREKAMLWLSDNLYSSEQLAVFSCCEESLKFLLDKISHPVHRISQISAIHLLRYFPRLFGYQDEAAQALLACCTIPVDGNEGLCYNALETLSSLKIVTPVIASELIARYNDCPDVDVRWGMYQLLVRSGYHNMYVQFFLDGIAYTHGNNRIANETIALVDGLKALSAPESIQTALQYLAQVQPMSLYEEDEVYETLCNRAAEQFLQGQTEHYQTLMNCYLASAKHYSQRRMHAIAHFFEVTGTIEDAIAGLCNTVEHYLDLDALFCHSENLTQAKKAYCDGKLENHALFRDIVTRHANDAQYQEYRNLILQIDGIALPEREPRIDYEKLKQQRAQEYFDILFDREKAKELLLLAIQKTQFPDPTVKDLVQSSEKFEYGSPLWELIYGIHRHLPESTRAANIFQALNWTQFLIIEAFLSIRHTESLQVSDEQKLTLCQSIQSLYIQGLLENAVTYTRNSAQTPIFIVAAVSLTVYLELIPEEAVLLQMTELPDFCFSKKDDTQKYKFLKSHIPEETLLRRMVENVKTNKVHGLVLREHIQYCMECSCEDIREAAVETVSTDVSARTAAIEYLYKVFGPRCIQKEILPSADQKTLLDIERLCPELSKEHLRIAMEREFQVTSSLELMAHLIILESEMALCEYIRLAEVDKTLPEKENLFLNGPTEAISTLRNPELLPLLERLMEIALSPDFQDGEFCSLRSSLSNALVACGNTAFENVMAILQSHQGAPENNEYAFRFCSYTMDLLKQKSRMKLDAPWKLCEVKCTLKTIS